jgi:hypothetical protein
VTDETETEVDRRFEAIAGDRKKIDWKVLRNLIKAKPDVDHDHAWSLFEAFVRRYLMLVTFDESAPSVAMAAKESARFKKLAEAMKEAREILQSLDLRDVITLQTSKDEIRLRGSDDEPWPEYELAVSYSDIRDRMLPDLTTFENSARGLAGLIGDDKRDKPERRGPPKSSIVHALVDILSVLYTEVTGRDPRSKGMEKIKSERDGSCAAFVTDVLDAIGEPGSRETVDRYLRDLVNQPQGREWGEAIFTRRRRSKVPC